MQDMEENEMDLVVTDPPYGIGESNEQNQTRANIWETTDYGDYTWDDDRVDVSLIEEVCRVSKNQVIFGGNYYTDVLPPSSCWIVWDKQNGDSDFADCELAWTSFDTAVRKIEFLWHGFRRAVDPVKKKREERVHPTQKPIELMRQIISMFADDGDTVFDPFCGSGSTLIAAQRCGLSYIGVEKKSQTTWKSRGNA